MPAYSLLARRFADEQQRYQFTKNGKDVVVQNGADLYLKNARTSVSQLTDFFKCPYNFYFRYGLNVKPREVAQLQSSDLGNIIHAVLETYVRDMSVSEDDETTRVKAAQCFENALSDDFYKGLRSDPRMRGALNQLQTECLRLCQIVKEQLVTSDFQNLATEMAFGAGEEFPPVEVKFDGGQFDLVGKIDRVDTFGERYIVIDYKSGASAAKYGEKDLYLGHKMQLLVYMKAVQNAYPKLRPAGFYYFNVHNRFSQAGVDKVYFYNGRTLQDYDIACAIDKKLSDGKSDKLGLTLTAKGAVSGRGPALTDEQFDNQIEYAFRLIANAGNLMSKGYAAVNPYEHACEYCDYKDICDFGDVYAYDARKVSRRITKSTIDKTVKK